MRVSFIFPSKPHKPVGGYKIAFEYANRLADDGIEVSLLYPIHLDGHRTVGRRIYDVLRYLKFKGRFSSNIWFPLNPKVKETILYSLDRLPASDAYVCTSVETAIALNKARTSKGSQKFYFIQNFENWAVSTEKLLETYRYPFVKIAINPYLVEAVEGQGQQCHFVPNGFNPAEYSMSIPVKDKEPATVSILYHTLESKDFKTGLEALTIAHGRHPELKALIFGAYDRPEGLPDWCEFYHNPDLQTHNQINNRAAIYLGPSRLEGFCLTIGEAMMCGQAVACTDIPGYTVLARNGENALVSEVGNAGLLADNLVRLIEDQELRISLAESGHRLIEDYTMDKAYARFKDVILSFTSEHA